jgi:GT2 family glycosyltransferase
MQHLKGGPAPFFLSTCTPRLRDDALLTHALEALAAGWHADALIAVEGVCRRFPLKSIPAILRAKVLQEACSEMAARAWYGAWQAEPENPLLQDAMLQAWLRDGAKADVAELGPAFLPARCRVGQHATLLPLLRAAGIRYAGACWKDGDAIAGMIFAPEGGAPRARLLVSDETHQYEVEVATDGSRFRVNCPRPGAVWSLAVALPDGTAQLLPGSPLAFYPPASAVTLAPAFDEAPLPVSIVIPVYRELKLVQACLNSVLGSLAQNRTPARVVVVNDASPEPALSAWLDKLAASGRITLLRNARNLGFIEAVNRGLRQHPDHDALLLNADTQVHGNWIDRLAGVLFSAPDVASVTPWSNNGEISSFPTIAQAAPAPDAAQLALIDRAAAALRAGGGTADVELPSCCGFTMLIRRRVLDAIGLLDGSTLVRGYGEEVDWCMRARAAGWRHLQATGVFVAHAGTVSFRAEKTLRVAQNRSVLAARYPQYHAEYARFCETDPLAAARTGLRQVLASRAAGWLKKAETAQPTAALPAAVSRQPANNLRPLTRKHERIAVWRVDPLSEAGRHVLALARHLASRPELGLRLLVIGHASEALWHTGVADIMPDLAGKTSPALADLQLLQLAGCRVILTDRTDAPVIKMTCVRLDQHFDSGHWLAAWAGAGPHGKAA